MSARPDLVDRRAILRVLKKMRAEHAKKMRAMSRLGYGINAGICAVHVQTLDDAIIVVAAEPSVDAARRMTAKAKRG